MKLSVSDKVTDSTFASVTVIVSGALNVRAVTASPSNINSITLPLESTISCCSCKYRIERVYVLCTSKGTAKLSGANSSLSKLSNEVPRCIVMLLSVVALPNTKRTA